MAALNLYKQTVRKALGDPVICSGVKLARHLGVLDTISQKPMAARAIATQLNMKERFILELSHAMTASGVVSMNAEGILSIPKEDTAFLLEEAGKAKWEPHLEATLPVLLKCFPVDGSKGYNLDEAPAVLELINQSRAPATDKLIKAFIANINLYHPDKQNITDVLDFGCGTGDITVPLAKSLDGVSVTGCDTSPLAIESATKASGGVKNINFVQVDTKTLDESWTKKFDVILLFDVLHDLPYPEETMTQVKNVLKDDGILIIIDPGVSSNPLNNLNNPRAAYALTVSTFYCVPSSCNHLHSHALGVSWGNENKEMFLTKQGLIIKNQIALLDSLFFHTFVCVKDAKKGKMGKK
ncbi:uncharacterized protein LOC117335655 [Pecten maximus]|uniref:uncharacterized protein LOC117335655 n=1 Tax=Pecten maximus TaxID=6579 RepID=UPI001458AA44|nr:uncharacterized protein LOC117335655 [Pecten maximus]